MTHFNWQKCKWNSYHVYLFLHHSKIVYENGKQTLKNVSTILLLNSYAINKKSHCNFMQPSAVIRKNQREYVLKKNGENYEHTSTHYNIRLSKGWFTIRQCNVAAEECKVIAKDFFSHSSQNRK